MMLNKLACIVLAVAAVAIFNIAQAATVTHNISSGSLTIAGNSTDNYIITGTTSSYTVTVQSGYHGAITLKDLSITSSYSPIAVYGQYNCSNLAPVTVVDVILEGNNTLTYTGSGHAAFQVDQGAQVNIGTGVKSSDCTSSGGEDGSLTAAVTTTSGGAGIGAPIGEIQGSAVISGYCSSNTATAGGNIVISGGTITAHGGHGAGIGGGYQTYYNGMIVIYGGTVNATAMHHAAGIGSGCPNGNGVEQCYAPNSAIIALPPSQISAMGAGSGSATSLGLAGANSITYIGDPAKPLVTVKTEDNTPNANIYVDLSENSEIQSIMGAIVPAEKLDIHQVKFGSTSAAGVYTFNGILKDNTTFFTDAVSAAPATKGKPYKPTITMLPSGGTVVLEMIETNLVCEASSSVSLQAGYTAAAAQANACLVKITYSDMQPTTNITFDIAKGAASDFLSPTFYDADSVTEISAPTTLKNGDVLYVTIPLKSNKNSGVYSDVFRFTGTWSGQSTGYIRQIITQKVVTYNSETICSSQLPYVYGTHTFPEGTASGSYDIVLKNSAGCDSIVTLQLTVNQLYNIADSKTICSNELPYTYGTRTFPLGTTSGSYEVAFKSAAGCDSVVTLKLQVVEMPKITAMPDTFVCYGTEITLRTLAATGEVAWSVSPTTFSVTAAQTYIATTSNPPCPTVSDTVRVGVEAQLYIQPDALPPYAYNRPYTQQLTSNAGFTAVAGLPTEFNFNPISGVLQKNQNTENSAASHELTVFAKSKSECEISKQYVLQREVLIPDIFTPNGDGINDHFMSGSKIMIFNRLGVKVFEGSDGWDGTINGKTAESDTYFYVLFIGNDKKTGYVTIW